MGASEEGSDEQNMLDSAGNPVHRASEPPAGWRPDPEALSRLYAEMRTVSGAPPEKRKPRLPARGSAKQRKSRAYVTLLARGTGSYVSPLYARKPEVPDYVATALPMICSFQRVQSAYPLIILAANLSASELRTLREVGGSAVHDIIDITSYQRQQPPAGRVRASPRSCLVNLKGSWMVHGRRWSEGTHKHMHAHARSVHAACKAHLVFSC